MRSLSLRHPWDWRLVETFAVGLVDAKVDGAWVRTIYLC